MNISSQEVTKKIADYSDKMIANTTINPDFYNQYHVFRGLRDLNGNGVLTGLTEISEIKSKEIVDGKEIPCEGKLYYRGVDIEDIVKSCIKEKRFGYEEVCYLLLFGELRP